LSKEAQKTEVQSAVAILGKGRAKKRYLRLRGRGIRGKGNREGSRGNESVITVGDLG